MRPQLSPHRPGLPSCFRSSNLMFPEPVLWVCDLSQRPRVLNSYLDMLACHRLLKKSVDAPEVNENIWFLPDLLTSRLGHMSWQVTRVLRRIGDRSSGLLLFFHPQPRNTNENVLGSKETDKDWPVSRWNLPSLFFFILRISFCTFLFNSCL